VKPEPIRQVAGTDALRYFLLREIVFGQDGSFSYDALVGRYNSDLANGLGNLVSRTLTMINRYCGGIVPQPAEGLDFEIGKKARAEIVEAVDCFENFEFSRGLESIWSLQAAVDKYIVEHKPWDLAARGEDGKPQLEQVLATAAETLRVVTLLLYPVIPDAAQKIWRQLGEGEPLEVQRVDRLQWGEGAGGKKIGAIEGVFPRLDKTEAISKMRELEEQANRPQAAAPATSPAAAGAPASDGKITIDDFTRVDLRVGLVKSAERVKGADMLLH
jgi:methionyl-tRNA synthetase